MFPAVKRDKAIYQHGDKMLAKNLKFYRKSWEDHFSFLQKQTKERGSERASFTKLQYVIEDQ